VKLYMRLGDDANAAAAVEKVVGDYLESDGVAGEVDEVEDAYRKAEQYEKALALYQEVVASWSESSKAMCPQVSAVKLHERYGKARELYQYVADHWPDADYAVESLGNVVRMSILAGDDANTEGAIELLLERYSGDERLAEVVDNVADDFREYKRYVKARELYQYVADHWPDADYAVNSLGGVIRASILARDDANAAAATELLLERYAEDKGLAKVVNEIAGQYERAKKYEKARELYRYAIERWPGADGVIDSKGATVLCSISLDDEPNALAAVDALLTEFAGHPDLGAVVGKIEEAYYVKILANDEQPLDKAYYENPRAVWEKVTTRIPDFFYNDPDLYYFIACCYYQLADYQPAISYYQIVVDNWPQHRNARGAGHLINDCYAKLEATPAGQGE